MTEDSLDIMSWYSLTASLVCICSLQRLTVSSKPAFCTCFKDSLCCTDCSLSCTNKKLVRKPLFVAMLVEGWWARGFEDRTMGRADESAGCLAYSTGDCMQEWRAKRSRAAGPHGLRRGQLLGRRHAARASQLGRGTSTCCAACCTTGTTPSRWRSCAASAQPSVCCNPCY